MVLTATNLFLIHILKTIGSFSRLFVLRVHPKIRVRPHKIIRVLLRLPLKIFQLLLALHSHNPWPLCVITPLQKLLSLTPSRLVEVGLAIRLRFLRQSFPILLSQHQPLQSNQLQLDHFRICHSHPFPLLPGPSPLHQPLLLTKWLHHLRHLLIVGTRFQLLIHRLTEQLLLFRLHHLDGASW